VGICYAAEGPANRAALDFPEQARVWGRDQSGTTAVLEEIKQWRPDLIFCHGETDLQFEAQLLELAPGIFFAHNYHASCISGLKTTRFPKTAPCSRRFGPGCLVQYFPRRCGGLNPVTMLQLYRNRSARLHLLQKYAAIVTNSECLAEEYRRHGLQAQCLPLFAQGSVQPSARKPASPQRWRLLFIGRMEELKGGGVFLQAAPAIRGQLDRDLEIILIGDGPQRGAWQKSGSQIESAHRGISTRFKGWLEEPELNSEIDEADLLVVPSLWPEPFGLVGIECGLRGLPAVAFAVGGIPEWLHDGENGYVAAADPPKPSSLARAIVRALHPANYEKLCQNARKLALHWSLERHCDACTSLIEEIVAASRTAEDEDHLSYCDEIVNRNLTGKDPL
jgi:glycosyltransferase involved in cell wall biosynthesis